MALLASFSRFSITNFSLVFLSILQLACPPCFAYWVSHTPNGSLAYQTLPNGDRIMDFSSAGYHQGSSPFPQPPVMLTLKPSGGNDSQQIQHAIDYVASLPLDSSTGLRGAIQLSSGTFDVRNSSFSINASGIVILGNGTDNVTGTVLFAQQQVRSPLFIVRGADNVTEVGSRAIVKQTAPSGTKEIYVDTLEGFSVGDQVLVSWPFTEAWLEMMNMTTVWKKLTNVPTMVERRIASIDSASTKITLDIPIPFRIDTQYLDAQNVAYVTKFTHEGRIREVGFANFLAMQEPVLPHGNGTFLVFFGVEDSWARNVIVQDFGGDTMTIAGKGITIQDFQLIRTITGPPHGPKPADIALQYPGSQILVTNTTCVGNHEFNFLTRNGANGPNVFHNCKGIGTAKAQPHAQWATGLLYDNLQTTGSIDIINRNQIASWLDHGFSAGYSVVWHSNSSSLTLVNPPGAANWAIGCNSSRIIPPGLGQQGYIEPNGIPSADLLSLYEAQKCNTL